jgi:DNA-binding MarR family transcriptional regulator
MPLSRFEQADDSPGFLLWQLTNLWQQRIRSALTPLGITHVQFVLLASVAWLEDSGKLVSQAFLSRHAHTDVMMTSQVVRTLEEKGLLTRAVHPTDTRARAVSLTAEGRKVAQQAFTVVETVDEQFFLGLGERAPDFVKSMQLLIRAHTEAQGSSQALNRYT